MPPELASFISVSTGELIAIMRGKKHSQIMQQYIYILAIGTFLTIQNMEIVFPSIQEYLERRYAYDLR